MTTNPRDLRLRLRHRASPYVARGECEVEVCNSVVCGVCGGCERFGACESGQSPGCHPSILEHHHVWIRFCVLAVYGISVY